MLKNDRTENETITKEKMVALPVGITVPYFCYGICGVPGFILLLPNL